MKDIPGTRQVLLPVSVATALSLLGDTTLYTVLPTHTAEAGVVLGAVGILLSANRWIRLPLTGPAGYFLENRPRRPFFLIAVLLGAFSTAMYALDQGFWTLLTARLLWGIAWIGIWVGGNTIILDISTDRNRGRVLGAYQVAFFAGAGGGALAGGALTDLLGYHAAMAVSAGLTLLGGLLAWRRLPETRPPVGREPERPPKPKTLESRGRRSEILSAAALMAAGRLVQEGLLLATIALFLARSFGADVIVAGVRIGTATVTGFVLGLTTLVAALAAPLAGALSDRTGNRWRVAALSLIPGFLGFAALQAGSPAWVGLGLAGVSIASASSANLSTALIGDLGLRGQHGRRLGGLFTIGDLASALGPPLAFWLLFSIGLEGVYWLAAGVLAATALLAAAWGWGARPSAAGGA